MAFFLAKEREKSREGPSAQRSARKWKIWLGAARAHLRALRKGAPLPPGTLRGLTAGEEDDPNYLLRLSERHGPIVKAFLKGKVTICIFGLARGRRFLAVNERDIRAATVDFTPLFPHGTLRQMTGERHLEHRRRFVEAFKTVNLPEHDAAIRQIFKAMLERLLSQGGLVDRHTIQAELKRATTEILFRLVLGIDRRWPSFDRMADAYERYAPHGTPTTVRREQHASYADLRNLLDALAREPGPDSGPPSLLGYFVRTGTLDETVAGNLLQMTEAGRFDAMGLLLWLISMLGAHRNVVERIAAEPDPSMRAALSDAAVLEALRLEQSEFVLRRATSDIVFDGYFIPKRSIVRIAVWEAHKDEANFRCPFQFDPERFLKGKPTADAYSPFGLDKHRCLGAEWVTSIGAIFVEEAALNLSWEIMADGAPAQGTFHFEPNRGLKVQFRPRLHPIG